MLILGIDPGTALAGYGFVEQVGSRLRLVEAGAIRTPADWPAQQRLLCLHDELARLVALHKPEGMAVEKLFFNRNVRTAMAVGEARGAILLVAARFALPLAEYTPPAVKLAVTGVGSADKQQVATMVCRLLGLSRPPTPDDVTDALAVAICHLHHSTTLARWQRSAGGGRT